MTKKSQVEEKTTPVDNEDRLGLLKARLALAKAWCKKPHKAIKDFIKEYELDDVTSDEEVRDRVRIPYIFRRTESDLPAMFDDQPELFFKGKNPTLKDIEPKVLDVYDWLWDTQTLEEKIEDSGTYFLVGGIGVIESPWVTKTKQVPQEEEVPVTDEKGNQVIDPQTGMPVTQMGTVMYDVPVVDNPMGESKDIFKIFFSPETKFSPVLDSAHCPYLFSEMTMSKEEVKAKFGKDVDPDESLKFDDTDVDKAAEDDFKGREEDLKRVTVYEYYGVLPEEIAKGLGDWNYDKEYHIYFTKNIELKSEESQYEVKPFFLVGNYGMANKFWKFGEAKILKLLVKELESYRSQILKHTRKMVNPKPLIEANSEVDETTFNDPRVGKPVKYTGIAPTYLSPAQLGGEVQIGVDMVRTDLSQSSGSFELASGSNAESTVKTPRGIQVFSEAADKNIRRKKKKISRFIRQIILFQLKQIGLNWKPDDPLAKEVLGEDVNVNAQILTLLADDHILAKLDIEVESLSINHAQIKQDSLDLMDMALKSEQLHPGLVNLLEFWKDTLQNGYGKKDADRYLTSIQQIQQQGIQQFIQQIATTNPELAGAIAQQIQQPYAPQLQKGGSPNAEVGGENVGGGSQTQGVNGQA